MSLKKIIISILIVFALVGASLLSYKAYTKYAGVLKERILLTKRKQEWNELQSALQNKVNSFRGTVGLVIEDLDTRWRISINEDKLIPAASLVKVPIMLSCFYAVRDGKIKLDDTVVLRSSDKVAGSKVLGDEPAGSVFTVEELLNPMITQSDNSAANTLIDFMGFDTLGTYFKKMGLKNTNLARKMMDFKERSEGEENYTTAGDMAYLLEELYYNNFLGKGVSEKCLEILGRQKINDRIPRKLPKGTFVAHKTGLERYVCHDVGIVFTNKGDFLICVLAKHDDKLAKLTKRFISDVSLLTYNYYQSLD